MAPPPLRFPVPTLPFCREFTGYGVGAKLRIEATSYNDRKSGFEVELLSDGEEVPLHLDVSFDGDGRGLLHLKGRTRGQWTGTVTRPAPMLLQQQPFAMDIDVAPDGFNIVIGERHVAEFARIGVLVTKEVRIAGALVVGEIAIFPSLQGEVPPPNYSQRGGSSGLEQTTGDFGELKITGKQECYGASGFPSGYQPYPPNAQPYGSYGPQPAPYSQYPSGGEYPQSNPTSYPGPGGQPTSYPGPGTQPTAYPGPGNPPTVYSGPGSQPTSYPEPRGPPPSYPGVGGQPIPYPGPGGQPTSYPAAGGQPLPYPGPGGQLPGYPGPGGQPTAYPGYAGKPEPGAQSNPSSVYPNLPSSQEFPNPQETYGRGGPSAPPMPQQEYRRSPSPPRPHPRRSPSPPSGRCHRSHSPHRRHRSPSPGHYHRSPSPPGCHHRPPSPPGYHHRPPSPSGRHRRSPPPPGRYRRSPSPSATGQYPKSKNHHHRSLSPSSRYSPPSSGPQQYQKLYPSGDGYTERRPDIPPGPYPPDSYGSGGSASGMTGGRYPPSSGAQQYHGDPSRGSSGGYGHECPQCSTGHGQTLYGETSTYPSSGGGTSYQRGGSPNREAGGHGNCPTCQRQPGAIGGYEGQYGSSSHPPYPPAQ